ncbi:PhzF family phenazine biosynthesis isomerase [Nostocoides sp. F2B08]|uniref:PhzF family phenazine biosynthesis protein n=1 Tax=Nostocoides sp. F2B08 TaxID=2653936 RepID=UPI001263E151|nr:PhzF family phenazine biosynthesis protein [Tetrasphaera sp. F2B08]KAB7743561.1 PhzF family phenazine biosynthesis isomerase [Tetrasphaera sp. F2B08]
MTTPPRIERYAAFSDDPAGGNPAGVVLDAASLGAVDMQRIAAQVGYSETAFVTGPIVPPDPHDETSSIPIRFFAPEGEVDFCGHATIATAVSIGEHHGLGDYVLGTRVGPVPITARREGSRTVGALHSPPVDCLPLENDLLTRILEALRWSRSDLDPALPPAVGFGGNRHPVLVARELDRLQELDYDFGALQSLSRRHDWITVQLVASIGSGQWRARDPFPWGGVVEDPATGAAAAAFAGYLRAHAGAIAGDRLVITQGVEMGRPSRIEVELTEGAAIVSGAAVRIDTPDEQ